jgi:hypothetical protein
MMPIRMRRKRRALEKVENLYRTARAQNDSINTPKQIGSRLRYPRRARVRVRTLSAADLESRRVGCARTVATRS